MKRKVLFLVGLTTTLLLTSCGNEEQKKDPQSNLPEITDVINGTETHHITTGTHNVSVDFEGSNTILVSKAYKPGEGLASEFIIVYDNTPSEKDKALSAAQFISGKIFAATGYNIPLEPYDKTQKCRPNTHYIFVGCRNEFNASQLTMPQKDLGLSGYYIKTKNSCVFIECEKPSGYQMASIAFLKHVVGFDYYTDDFETYTVKTGDDVKLPIMDIVELPDFDTRNYVNNGSKARLYALGYTPAAEIFIPVGGNAMHNCNDWLPYKNYGAGGAIESHPDWYADTAGSAGYQLCYTAHGHAEEYEKMLNTCLDVMEYYTAMYPNVYNITLTQLDERTNCKCDVCTGKDTHRDIKNPDGQVSSSIIRFMNDLDTKYRQNHPDSKVNLIFFAYHNSLGAPKLTVEQDPTLKCHEHVFPIIAPINARYNKSFYDPINYDLAAQHFESWSKYTDKFCAWIYECNYKNYMYPYNSYQSMVDTYKFLKNYNTNIMYNEGQRYNTAVPCFGRFKDYIDSKLNVDVNVSFTDLKRTFFDNYYGAAGPYMEELFNQEVEWLSYIESNLNAPGDIYEDISKKNYWPKQLLNSYLELCDKAYEAIAPLRTTDNKMYSVFHDHINIESMFPRFALIDLHGASYTPDELLAMKLAFKSDCELLGIQEYQEVHKNYPVGSQGYMSEKFKQWGIE